MVNVDLTNTGNRTGDEVVQLYVKHHQSKIDWPRKELKGFQRVTLRPGETKTAQIPLKASDLAYWDEALQASRVEAKPVDIMIGSSSSGIKLTTTIHIQ